VQHEGVTSVPVERSSTQGLAGLAALSSLAVLVANASGIATGDDGVGYRAIADSLLAGEGLGYFLEDPVTVWPPLWPALMALVAKVTPLDTLGAAIVLNAAVAFAVVVFGNRLLRQVVTDQRLVWLGTVVLAFGPTTIGFGRLLMTDMAFALLTVVWMLALLRHHRTAAVRDLLGAALLVWVGFGLRYVGLVLIGFGGLWLLLDHRRALARRVRDAALYGVASAVVPALWMLRNHSIDGTFTGERHASARGLVDNGFDIAATIGRFLLPGLGYGLTYLWAAVGVVTVLAGLWLVHRVLADRYGATTPAAVVRALGTPVGLLALTGVLYLAYMLYVRTTTALNQLDVRLLYPSYLPLLFLGLALADRMLRPRRDRSPLPARAVLGGTAAWAGLNVVAGLVAMVAFALGHPYFSGNYEADQFDRVRADEALDAVPEGCEVYSNLPNALYPRLEARWSPMRTALESREAPDPDDSLDAIEARAAREQSCLVWIDLPPRYGHLWSLDELHDELSLTRLASGADVEVFRLEPST